MKLSPEIKGLILGLASGLAAVGLAFAAGQMVRARSTTAASPTEESVVPPTGTLAYQGYKLFLLNCAHCHSSDARGDEGPDLHGITKSDARIAFIIKNGSKGEMPKFGAKLNDTDIKTLIAFLRSLKD